MPKIKCRCGNIIDLTPIPAPDGFKMVKENDIEALYNAPSVDDVVDHIIYSQQGYLCSVCGRMIVLQEQDDNQVSRFYVPE